MDANSTTQKALEWFGLVLAIVFITIGIGILFGFLLPGRLFFGGGMRALIGIILVGYGTVRAVMSFKKIKGGKNGEDVD